MGVYQVLIYLLKIFRDIKYISLNNNKYIIKKYILPQFVRTLGAVGRAGNTKPDQEPQPPEEGPVRTRINSPCQLDTCQTQPFMHGKISKEITIPKEGL